MGALHVQAFTEVYKFQSCACEPLSELFFLLWTWSATSRQYLLLNATPEQKTINNGLGLKWKRHLLGSKSETHPITNMLAQPKTERLPGTVQAITRTGVNRKSSEFQEFRSASHLLPGISRSHPTLFISPTILFSFFPPQNNWLSGVADSGVSCEWAKEEMISTLLAANTTASSLWLSS